MAEDHTGTTSPRGTMVDYYRHLEIPKSATATDIKKAYRRLALRWHPDKNPEKQDVAEKRFKEISEAYEVLSDERKKRVYDQYGKEGLTNGAGNGASHRHHNHAARHGGRGFFFEDFSESMPFGFHFRDPSDVFKEFFGDDLFGGIFGGHHPSSTLCQHGTYANGHGQPSRGHQGHHVGAMPIDPFNAFHHQAFNPFHGFTVNPFESFAAAPFAPQAGPWSGTVRKTSTQTRFANGKQIVTKTVTEQGSKTVLIFEDGAMVSKAINGVPQPLT